MLRPSWIAIAATVHAAGAAALSFEPGQWEVTMVMQSPMMGERRQTRSECVEEGDFDPTSDFMNDDTCHVTDLDETATTLKWKMQCGPANGPQMVGAGEFISKGKTASGKMLMTMFFAGQNLVMTSHWSGRHLGPCTTK